jgi:hypothetical protein
LFYFFLSVNSFFQERWFRFLHANETIEEVADKYARYALRISSKPPDDDKVGPNAELPGRKTPQNISKILTALVVELGHMA